MATAYDAFISYSHAADGKLAPALESALEGFAKPWYRRRALNLFRDQTSLSATPGLWPAIEQRLASRNGASSWSVRGLTCTSSSGSSSTRSLG